MTLRRSLTATAVTALLSSIPLLAPAVAVAATTGPTGAPPITQPDGIPGNFTTSSTVPAGLTAGAAPVPLDLTVTNHLHQPADIGLTLSFWTTMGDPTVTPSQIKVDYLDPATNAWRPLRITDQGGPTSDEVSLGRGPSGQLPLADGATHTYTLRIAVTADTPAVNLHFNVAASTDTNHQVLYDPANPTQGFPPFLIPITAADGTTPTPPPTPVPPGDGSNIGDLQQGASSGSATVVANPVKGAGPALSVEGLSGQVTAGGNPIQFTADITNTTDTDVQFFPDLWFTSESNTLASSQMKVQFQNPNTGTWQDATLSDGQYYNTHFADAWLGHADATGNGATPDSVFRLAKGASMKIPVRVSFTSDAPAGKALGLYLALSGGDDKTYETASDGYVFTIVKASPATTPPSGSGTGSGTTGQPVVYRPTPPPLSTPVQHGTTGKALAATGGDNSSATTLGIVGGIALVGGAGTLVVLRRRRTAA